MIDKLGKINNRLKNTAEKVVLFTFTPIRMINSNEKSIFIGQPERREKEGKRAREGEKEE